MSRKKDDRLGPCGVRLVEALTVGSVSGIVVTTLAFFVSNRLLPLGTTFLGDDRAQLGGVGPLPRLARESCAFAAATGRAWTGQCLAITTLALAAVALNWITTGDHPIGSLAHRHLWAVARMDCLLLVTVALAAFAAHRLPGSRTLR